MAQRDETVRRLSLLLVLALLFGSLSGCGRKAPPVPPGSIRPRPVKDLAARVIPAPGGIELTWDVPTRNTDGSPLRWVKGFQLFKAEIPLDSFCEGCPVAFDPPSFIPAQASPLETKRMTYEDRALREGMMYVYEVRTVKGWLSTSEPSNRVFIPWHQPPSQPSSLKARSLTDGLLLTWTPPMTWTDGKPLDEAIRYRVYRISTSERGWEKISGLLEQPTFLDTDVKPGLSYVYAVSSVFPFHGSNIEGPRTEPLEERYRSIALPAAPAGLVAVLMDHGVELLWQENPEADLSGYHVYRTEPDGKAVRITREPVAISRFVDHDRLPPGTYAYYVKAVDRETPPQEGPPSQTVHVDIP